MYVWTHAIALRGTVIAIHIAITHGRAIWHEQQQQQHEHELAADHYSCTPVLHASPLYACPLSQRLLIARSSTANQSSNELVGCRRRADTGVRAAAKPTSLTGPISCSMHSGGAAARNLQ
jgi:hypothetical protein